MRAWHAPLPSTSFQPKTLRAFAALLLRLSLRTLIAASSAPAFRGNIRDRSTRIRAGQVGVTSPRGALTPPSTHMPGMGPSVGGGGRLVASATALAAAAASGVPGSGAFAADPKREAGVAGTA